MRRFAREAFRDADAAGRKALAQELAETLRSRLRIAEDFHQSVRGLVEELRSLGHDLWSFDETDEMEVWCPNYQTPSGPGIVVTFTTEGVEVDWSPE